MCVLNLEANKATLRFRWAQKFKPANILVIYFSVSLNSLKYLGAAILPSSFVSSLPPYCIPIFLFQGWLFLFLCLILSLNSFFHNFLIYRHCLTWLSAFSRSQVTALPASRLVLPHSLAAFFSTAASFHPPPLWLTKCFC